MASKRVNELDIHELLALGEGLAQPAHDEDDQRTEDDDGSNSDSSGCFEEVEIPADDSQQTSNATSADGIVITVEAPPNVRKKKRKEFDAEAFIRRKLAQRSRELQLSLHKAHIVCIFASYKFLNQHVLNSPELQAVALSVVPSSECYPGKRADLDYLEKLTTWFKKKFKMSSSTSSEEVPLAAIEKVFREKRAHSGDPLVFAFVVLTRAMGLSSRLVVNFRPLPAKLSPPRTSVGGGGVEKEDEEPQPCSSKSVTNGETGGKSSTVSKNPVKAKESVVSKKPPAKRQKKTEATASSKKGDDFSDSSDDEEKPKTSLKKEPVVKKEPVSKKDVGKEKGGSAVARSSRSSSRLKNEEVEEENLPSTSSKKQELKKSSSASSRRKTTSLKTARKEESSDEEILRCDEVLQKTPAKESKTGKKAETDEKPVKKARTEKRQAEPAKRSSRKVEAEKKPAKKTERDACEDVQPTNRRSARAASAAATKKMEKIEATVSENDTDEVEDTKSTISSRIAEKKTSVGKENDSKRPSGSRKTDQPAKKSAETPKEKGKKIAPVSRKRKAHHTEEDDSDEDFKPEIIKVERRPSNSVDRRILTSEDEAGGSNGGKPRKGQDIWAEVFVEQEEKWVCVDVPTGKIFCVKEIQTRASKPFYYIVAYNNDGSAKEVTPRYDPNWGTNTKKHRVDPQWWRSTIKPFLESKTRRSKEEDAEFHDMVQQQPLPASIGAYKNHPLYALSRHLLKFEAIYPADAPPLGYVRGEAVYARECVHQLHSRETWIKEARVVRQGEKPYNIVKARPKYDKFTGDWVKDKPLEVFGKWQTEDYQPPVAENGVVPRNAFGNVELFKPSMLPIGCVHMQIPQLNRIAKKLGVDCAPAMVGWDYHGGWSHPAYDGFVVCAEFEDVLKDAYDQEMAMQAKREEEKRLTRVYRNWRRLVRGVLIKERIKNKYLEGESSQDGLSSWLDSPPKLEDSSEDEQEVVAPPVDKLKKKRNTEEEDLTLAAKMKKLAELEKLLGRKGPASSSKRKPRAPAASTRKKPEAKPPAAAKKGRNPPKRKTKSGPPAVDDPFLSSSDNDDDDDEEEDIETVRQSIKAGALPKKTYSTRGAKKSYKESESEDDGDMQISETSDEEDYD